MQLPAYFQPELPMNPWPEWEEWEGLGMGRVRSTLLRFRKALKAELVNEGGEVANQFESGLHDTECLVDMVDGIGAGVEYKRAIYREDDCRVEVVGEGEEEEQVEGEEAEEDPMHPLSICNAFNDIKEEYSIIALSYNTLSKGAKTMGHFGNTNRDWQAIIPLHNAGCLKIIVHRNEAIPREDEVSLFDDSFWTVYENICKDKLVGFIKADIQHPQFRAST
jgi:hypothetical protein